MISTSILGRGGAGKITITTDSLNLTNNSFIDASTLLGQGNAGEINIQVFNTTTLDKASGISSSVNSAAIGNAGKITINTGSLNLTASSGILTGILGQGNAGGITIATDSLNLTASSGISASLGAGAIGSGGDIDIQTGNLVVEDGGQISASTLGKGDSGNLSITADNSISLDASSYILNNVQDVNAVGNAGKIDITTGSLSASNGSQINSFTRGQGNAGNVTVRASNIELEGTGSDGQFSSGLFTTVESQARGDGGNLTINTDNLSLDARAQISAFTSGKGDAGKVVINATDKISLDNESTINSNVEQGAVGNGGQIEIDTNTLDLTNGGQVLTIVREARNNLPAGQGNAGNIALDVNGNLTLNGRSEDGQFFSAIYSYLSTGAEGEAGNLDIQAGNLVVKDGGEISSSTLGKGDSGNLSITVDDSISLDASSYILNNVQDVNAVGNAGKIDITTGSLSATNGSQINSFTRGQGNAGDITIQARNTVTFAGFDSDGSASGLNTNVEANAFGGGGNISLTAKDIRLRDDSDIRTDVFNGTGDGGNIKITADSIIAFDDSDIFAFAADGRGGNINLDTPAFFGENFTLNSLTTENTDDLQNNSRADVNATGAVSGAVNIPDVSFIQNSLTELPNNSINTDELVANSCVVPVGDRSQGKFIITGTESLPLSPGDGIPSKYPTGEVRNVPEHSSWQPGDPIVEPQGVYRLANGKLVLSRQCSQ